MVLTWVPPDSLTLSDPRRMKDKWVAGGASRVDSALCRKAHDLTIICALVPYLSSRIPKGTTVFLDEAALLDWTTLPGTRGFIR